MLADRIAAAERQGYQVVQEGAISGEHAAGRQNFSDRADGFDASLLGTYAAPTYRSAYDNLLLDDDERWVHLRRDRT